MSAFAADTVTIQSMKRVEINKEKPKAKTLFIENFYYQDFIYSRGKKTELGDQTQVNASFRYQYSDDSFLRTRFETFPDDNRFNNKTSRFELLAGHRYGAVDFTLDLELNTNEKDGTSDSGGTSIGLDLDSEFTNLDWQLTDKMSLAFYPFNFDGEVGVEFNTWDVTRIHFIEGAPTEVLPDSGNTKVVTKTIPGLVYTYGTERANFYIGAGLATYLYPTSPTYDLQNNATATRWERREVFGYKFGANARTENARIWFGVAGQNKTKETGSLIQSAQSAYGIFRLEERFILEAEYIRARNGKRPWRLDRSGTWFEQTETPGFFPIYSDYTGKTQEWVGATDHAFSFRFGYEVTKDLVPYAALRYQGEHFVFRGAESANLLRTANESQSHGGLLRGSLGTFLHYGNFVVNPEFEYRKAKNPVFTNAADAFFANNNQSQRLLARFQKTDYQFRIFLTYSFDGAKPFTP